MPDLFSGVQGLVALVLSFGAFGLVLYGFIDAIRTQESAFRVAGKQTKQIWLIILGIASALAFVSLGGLGIFTILAAIAGGIYVVDVRPAVKQTGGGRGSNEGPYGPW
ncbi:MAG TPA: DUF2516 family protein [Jiangellaceae bacterium]